MRDKYEQDDYYCLLVISFWLTKPFEIGATVCVMQVAAGGCLYIHLMYTVECVKG